MTVSETTKYIIFSSNELEIEYDKEWQWTISAYDDNVRRVQKNGPPNLHSREVKLPLSQFMSKEDYQAMINQLTRYGISPTDKEIRNEIMFNWGHVLGGFMGKNWEGEEKIVKEGVGLDGWQLWLDYKKRMPTGNGERRGNENTYQLKPALKTLINKITKEVDNDEVNDIEFLRGGGLPKDLHEEKLYLAIEKEYLKWVYENYAALVGLQTKKDDEEKIISSRNLAELERIVATKEKGMPSQPESPKPSSPSQPT